VRKILLRTKLVISFIVAILSIIIFSIPFAVPALAANDNFGNNGNGEGYAGGATGAIFFNQPGFTGTTSTGIGMSVLASNADGSNAHNIQLGLYTLSGSSFILVANTNSISIPAGATKQWFTGNFPVSINLTSTTYYLGFEADNNNVMFYYDSNPKESSYYSAVTFGTWPSLFSSPTSGGSLEWDIIVKYSTNSGSTPIITAANDNFGNNGNGEGYAGGATGAIFFNQPGFTGTTSTGIGMSVLASNADGSNAHNIQLGLYTLSGSSFILVANTNSISIPAGATKQWFTGNFPVSINLTSTTYYLGFEADNNNVRFYYDSNPEESSYYSAVTFGTWPSLFSSPTSGGSLEWDIIVKYSTNSGSTPIITGATIIAASNSDSSWKSQATAICSGTNDQNTINKYLTAGNTVELAPGTFNISGSGYINPASNSHLYGQGNATVINLQSSMIYISNKNNVEIDNFKITGTTVGVGAVFIGSNGAAVSGFNIHDILCTITGDQTDFSSLLQ